MKERIIKTILAGLPKRIVHTLVGEFVPIFMLHRLIDSDCRPLQKQIELLHQYLEYIRKKQYQPISLEKLVLKLVNGEHIPENSVVFTVDDGFSEQFEITGPIFAKFDISLTCFAITDFLDGKLWPWDDQVRYIYETTTKPSFDFKLPDGSRFYCEIEEQSHKLSRRHLINRLKAQNQTHIYPWLDVLYSEAEVEKPKRAPEQYKNGSWAQAEKFIKQGHSVAAHTKTHRILTQLNDQDAKDEILASFEYLEQKLPQCAKVFAYPSGQLGEFSSREEEIVSNSEMIGAVSAIPRTATKTSEITALPRFSLPNNMPEFLQYLSYIEVIKNKIRQDS